MLLFDEYKTKQDELFDYFGYVEDWRIIPLNDARVYSWFLDQEDNGSGKVIYWSEEEDFSGGNYYENEIYTQRHLPKWVYRGKDFTMICVDTHADGNQFLQIFDNSLERKELPKEIQEY